MQSEMKHRIKRNIYVALFTQLVLVIVDYFYFDEIKPFTHYVVAFVLLTILLSFASWLDVNGWNSWGKVFGLFRKNR